MRIDSPECWNMTKALRLGVADELAIISSHTTGYAEVGNSWTIFCCGVFHRTRCAASSRARDASSCVMPSNVCMCASRVH